MFACSHCNKTLPVLEDFTGAVVCSTCGKRTYIAPKNLSPGSGGSQPTVLRTDSRTALPSGVSAREVEALLAPPQTLDELGWLGPYRVLEVLGGGGMGIVFRAWDQPPLKRCVALKTLRPDLAADPAAKKRFLNEAQAVADIRHRHIVTVYHVGEDRGIPFLSMELLQGESLEDRLAREAESDSVAAGNTIGGMHVAQGAVEGRPLPIAEILHIGRQIADGLAAAHAKQRIHRDIKPLNIWLESIPTSDSSPSSTCVKILDFGLVCDLGAETRVTELGGCAGGTLAYIAPEQADGEAVDHRCDLYSLGCTLYRMCTGKLPPRLAVKVPKPPRELNPKVPPELSELVLSLLAREPADRPQTAAEVRERLARMQAGGSRVVHPSHGPGLHTEAYPPPRGSLALTMGLVAVFLVLLVAGLAFYVMWPEDEKPAPPIRLIEPVIAEKPSEDRKDKTPPKLDTSAVKQAEKEKKPPIVPLVVVPPMPPPDTDYVLKKILAYVQAEENHPPGGVRFLRFLSNHHLQTGGVSKEEIERHRRALEVVINARSVDGGILNPINAHDAIYAVDIRKLGWDTTPFTRGEDKTPANLTLFDLILLEYPYGVRRQGSETFTALWQEFLKLTGQARPISYVRGDWLVDAMTSAPAATPLAQLWGTKEPLSIRTAGAQTVTRRFRQPLKLATASAELDVSTTALQKLLASATFPARELAPLAANGTVGRDTWERSFDLVVAGLDLGIPVVPLDGSAAVGRDYRRTPDVEVELRTNKADNIFSVGDHYIIYVTNKSRAPIFIELIGTGVDGRHVPVELPSRRIAAGATLRIPPEGPGEEVGEQIGKEQLTLFASDQAFPLGELLQGQGSVPDRVVHSFYDPGGIVKKTIEIQTRPARLENHFHRLTPKLIDTLKKRGCSFQNSKPGIAEQQV